MPIISLHHTPHTDGTLRQYALDAASEGGLHELPRIPFDGRPLNVLADEERAGIVVQDVDTNGTTKGIYICRQVATAWQSKEVALTLDEHILIRCWTRLTEKHVAILDYNSENVLILEYV